MLSLPSRPLCADVVVGLRNVVVVRSASTNVAVYAVRGILSYDVLAVMSKIVSK